ncbi:MAG: class I SAM-dependent methyltransferase [Minicystis sp.]
MPSSDDAGFDFDTLFEADDYLHFYEETLRGEQTAAQVDFLEQQLSMIGPLRVLDLGCGHGRHANELAARGHDVVGVDLVQGFLDLAARDAEARGLTVTYARHDFRALPFEAAFDRAVCLFDAFGFFPDEDNLAVLAAIARALVPGGMLCLDVRNRDWMIKHLPPITVLEKGDDLMIDRHHFDTQSGRLIDRRILVRDGVIKRRPFSIRLYSLSELALLLGAVGLSVCDTFGDFRGAPVSMQHNRMVVIARKLG